MTIRTRTTPDIDIAGIPEALSDEELLARAFADCIDAVGRYAIEGRTVFHSILLLDEIREQFESKRGNSP